MGHDIIVAGASAGGIEAFSELIRELPRELPAAIFIVIHIPPSNASMLPQIFHRATRLNVVQRIKDGDPIMPGQIYVAPPDYHLLLEFGRVRLRHSPTEHWNRPAIDPLFRSAARAYGSRVIGIVLSGFLNDGTAGLVAISEGGGIVMVQDPEDALHPEMPRNAMKKLTVDYCLSVAQMPASLIKLVRTREARLSSSPRTKLGVTAPPFVKSPLLKS